MDRYIKVQTIREKIDKILDEVFKNDKSHYTQIESNLNQIYNTLTIIDENEFNDYYQKIESIINEMIIKNNDNNDTFTDEEIDALLDTLDIPEEQSISY